MFTHSVSVNKCGPAPCNHTGMVSNPLVWYVQKKIASKSTPQGLRVRCCMFRDLIFSTQLACAVHKYNTVSKTQPAMPVQATNVPQRCIRITVLIYASCTHDVQLYLRCAKYVWGIWKTDSYINVILLLSTR